MLNGLTSTNTISFDNTSFAVFGKLNWKVTDKLHIQPGLRVNYDKKSGFYESIVSIANAQYNFVATADNVAALLAAFPNPSAARTTFLNQINTLAPQRYSPRFSAWNVSGDLTLSYDVDARRACLRDLCAQLQIGRDQPVRPAAQFDQHRRRSRARRRSSRRRSTISRSG